MAQYNNSTQLNANWKEIYGESLDKLIPEQAVIAKKVKFESDNKTGDKHVYPVHLSHEHGVTYLGQNASVATLESHIAAFYKEAQIQPSETLLRSAISYNAADRMLSSKQSFKNWSSMLAKNMTNSLAKRNELDFLYGQTGIGTIGTVASASGTAATLTISDATWADAIWAGMETCTLDAFDSTLATQRSANAAFVISSVDFDNKQVSVTGNSTDIGNLAANDVFFFRGAYDATTHTAMAGIDKIVTNTGSLFNISAATYGLWKGNSYACGSAPLTVGKIFNGVSNAIARGLEGKVCVFVSPRSYANLNSDQSALRRYGGEKTGEAGFESLQFHSGNGVIEVVSHLYVKQGEAFGLPMDSMKRLGTTDITFKLPDAAAGGDVFLHIPDKSGYEIRARSSQAIFCTAPSRMVKWTGITNA